MDPLAVVPPPPPGFVLDAAPGAIPPPPPGFVMDGPAPAAAPAAAPAPPPAAADELLAAVANGMFPQSGRVLPEKPLWQTAGEAALEIPSNLAAGANRGLAGLFGAPVDLVNVSPMLLNLLPGEQGMRPMSPNPVGGAGTLKSIMDAPAQAVGMTSFPEPDNMLERFTQRIGSEVGTVVPFVGAGAKLASEVATGARSLDEMSAIERFFAEPMVRNPSGVASKEAAYATAAGTGAQTANEMFTLDNQGTAASDIGGSVAGALSYGGASGLLNIFRNLAAGATNSPRWMDDLAGEAVVDQIINNSQMMGRQAEPYMLRGEAPRLDTEPLAAALRTPAEVERLVPGYRADIGTRPQDPQLQTFVSDVNARSAGAGNAARTQNTAAVNAEVGRLAPQGDPAQFRLALQEGVDEQIASLFMEEQLARAAADEAQRGVTPQLPNETARGSIMREGLQGAYDEALDEVAQMYAAIEGGEIDPQALAARFSELGEVLPVEAPRPAAAGGPERVAAARGEGPVPFSEAQAIRSNLSDEQRAARAGSEPYRASIAGRYRDTLDEYLSETMAPEAAESYQAANRARFDVGQRFEEGNTAIAQSLRRTERGGYQLDPSALPRRFVQPDTGKISDYGALMREAGNRPEVRDAIADQVLADAQDAIRQGPEAVTRFISERNVVLSDFPEVRGRLEQAGVSTQTLRAAEDARTTAERDLTTRGRSPEGSYLHYSPDRVRDSVRQIVNDADPRAATQRLLETASGDPDAAVNLRTAFWEEVKGRGHNSATDVSGQDVWNARKVRDLFNDPKVSAVAEELWRDDPDDLQAIRDVFTALEAATPGKARAPGSSGTAQALSGRLDPSLTVTSIASRARSVKRGQMSPTIAGIDLLSTWMRNKSTQVQARAIDTLAAQVVNNPGLAADLLDKFNPANYAASRRMLTQKYGLRIRNVVELLDRANQEQEDPDSELKEAVDAAE